MKPPFVRYDHIGKWTMMVYTDGYVMCRRPSCHPTVISWAEWQKLSTSTLDPIKKAKIEAYQARGKAKALAKKADKKTPREAA